MRRRALVGFYQRNNARSLFLAHDAADPVILSVRLAGKGIQRTLIIVHGVRVVQRLQHPRKHPVLQGLILVFIEEIAPDLPVHRVDLRHKLLRQDPLALHRLRKLRLHLLLRHIASPRRAAKQSAKQQHPGQKAA